jgi:hypothetical protein
MASSLINFGPDLEPLASESRRASQFAEPRRDALAVAGACEEVVAKLIAAQGSTGGWCEFEQLDGRRIFINAATVRFVVDAES